MRRERSFSYAREFGTTSALQQLRFYPLAVTKGHGTRLHTDDGRTLLDLSASWGACSLGHGHPRYVKAVSAAASNPGGASLLSSAVEPAHRLAQKLLDCTPGTGERRVWLGHSGSDANETVARAVLAATGRSRIMAFSGAYHGGTAGSMAVSAHTAQEGAEKLPGLTLVPFPDPYRPFLNDPSGDRLLAHIEQLLDQGPTGKDVAAFFLEPIQADGGMIVPPPGFFSKLADLCAKHGILTICDEVKVGLGRTGRLHCFDHEGFVPDIICFGKGLGGGLPVSAVVGPASVLDFETAFSMQTLHGNPICASAACSVLDVIESENLSRNAELVGAFLQQELQALAMKYEVIGDVRGRGLAIGVELVADRQTREPAPQITAQVIYRAFELGAVLYYVGMHSNVLELTPPLTLTKGEAKEGLGILEQALKDVLEGRFDTNKLMHFGGW